MLLFKHTRDELLRARYNSLLNDVPVAILTALSAIIIQMIAFKDAVDWKLSILLPGIRMVVAAYIFVFWFSYRSRHADLNTIRRRLQIAGIIMMISGLLTFNRNLYLLDLTDSFGHYFLIFHTTMYGLCFALILSKMGPAAYLYNLILISSALLCVSLGNIEYQYTLTALILMFEIGMLLAMRASNQVFDRMVSATHESNLLLEENRRLANQDTLTHLPNRRHFFMNVDQLLMRAKSRGESFALGIVDLDNFKPINDAYGHHAGDLVLQEIGHRLLTMVKDHIEFYRLGGDEFAFLLRADDAQAALMQFGEEINQLISNPMHIKNEIVTIQASIGACVYAGEDDTAQKLYEHADSALYHAKRKNKGSLHIYATAPEPVLTKALA